MRRTTKNAEDKKKEKKRKKERKNIIIIIIFYIYISNVYVRKSKPNSNHIKSKLYYLTIVRKGRMNSTNSAI